MRYCKGCGKEISKRGKTGLCKSCFPHSIEFRKKISIANTNRIMSEKTRIALLKVNIGKVLNEKTKLALLATHLGKSTNEEIKSKISHALIGRVVSEETRKKMSIAFTGRKHTSKTKEKLRAAHLLYCKNNSNHCGISKSCTSFLNAIEQHYGIKIQREYTLDGRLFDGKWNNILIEVDGSYWHDPREHGDGVWINDNWKSIIAAKNGFELLRFTVNDIKQVNEVLSSYKDDLDKIFKISCISS